MKDNYSKCILYNFDKEIGINGAGDNGYYVCDKNNPNVITLFDENKKQVSGAKWVHFLNGPKGGQEQLGVYENGWAKAGNIIPVCKPNINYKDAQYEMINGEIFVKAKDESGAQFCICNNGLCCSGDINEEPYIMREARKIEKKFRDTNNKNSVVLGQQCNSVAIKQIGNVAGGQNASNVAVLGSIASNGNNGLKLALNGNVLPKGEYEIEIPNFIEHGDALWNAFKPFLPAGEDITGVCGIGDFKKAKIFCSVGENGEVDLKQPIDLVFGESIENGRRNLVIIRHEKNMAGYEGRDVCSVWKDVKGRENIAGRCHFFLDNKPATSDDLENIEAKRGQRIAKIKKNGCEFYGFATQGNLVYDRYGNELSGECQVEYIEKQNTEMMRIRKEMGTFNGGKLVKFRKPYYSSTGGDNDNTEEQMYCNKEGYPSVYCLKQLHNHITEAHVYESNSSKAWKIKVDEKNCEDIRQALLNRVRIEYDDGRIGFGEIKMGSSASRFVVCDEKGNPLRGKCRVVPVYRSIYKEDKTLPFTEIEGNFILGFLDYSCDYSIHSHNTTALPSETQEVLNGQLMRKISYGPEENDVEYSFQWGVVLDGTKNDKERFKHMRLREQKQHQWKKSACEPIKEGVDVKGYNSDGSLTQESQNVRDDRSWRLGTVYSNASQTGNGKALIRYQSNNFKEFDGYLKDCQEDYDKPFTIRYNDNRCFARRTDGKPRELYLDANGKYQIETFGDAIDNEDKDLINKVQSMPILPVLKTNDLSQTNTNNNGNPNAPKQPVVVPEKSQQNDNQGDENNNNKTNNQDDSLSVSQVLSIVGGGAGFVALTLGVLDGTKLINIFKNDKVAVVLGVSGGAIVGVAVFFFIRSRKETRKINNSTANVQTQQSMNIEL